MINLILGQQGSGKTLLAVAKAYEQFQKGKTVYSNVKLTFPFTKLNYDDIIKCKLKNGVVLIDEIHLLLPARACMTKISRNITDGFLSMVRKKGLIIYGTTQTLRKVDVRFREEADFIYNCKKFAQNPKNKNWSEIIHNQNLPIKIPIMIQAQVIETFSGKTVIANTFANSIYDLYDTNQIIKIEGLNI